MAGDFILARFRPVLDPGRRDKVHAIALTAHDVSGHVVRDDPVGLLRLALELGIDEQIVGFRRKADQQARPKVMASERREDIGVLDEP